MDGYLIHFPSENHSSVKYYSGPSARCYRHTAVKRLEYTVRTAKTVTTTTTTWVSYVRDKIYQRNSAHICSAHKFSYGSRRLRTTAIFKRFPAFVIVKIRPKRLPFLNVYPKQTNSALCARQSTERFAAAGVP